MDPVANPECCHKFWRGRCPVARKRETDGRSLVGRSALSRSRVGDSRNQQSSGRGRRKAQYGIHSTGGLRDPQSGDRGKSQGTTDVVILSSRASKKVTRVGQ